jgi:hypothetical protein
VLVDQFNAVAIGSWLEEEASWTHSALTRRQLEQAPVGGLQYGERRAHPPEQLGIFEDLLIVCGIEEISTRN